ncbi:MAG: deoxyribonuclease IV [Dehalococcoidia bacterium]
MKVGAHVSGHGDLANRFDHAVELGAEAIQIFGAPPQTWNRRKIRPEECDGFRARMKETGIEPVFIHGVYLINLATEKPDQLEKSKAALRGDLDLASAIGARGVIFHVGSHKGAGFQKVLPQIARALSDVLAETPDDAWIVLENNAGQGGGVGSKFEELGAIMAKVKSPRLKVCLDTQHAYASGYDLANADGVEKAMQEFEREVGVENLVAVHANDSKIELGKGVDRHENIGKGHIGRKGFEAIMAHKAFQNVPFLLEVPGEGEGPDKPNVDLLKRIRKKAGGDP